MPGVNLFIGGTGVQLALYVEKYRKFYELKEDLPVFALDTDRDSQRIAKQVLGDKLQLPGENWLERVRGRAEHYRHETFKSLYGIGRTPERYSFGDLLLRATAEVVQNRLKDVGGLYTLRTTGWLAWEDINAHDPEFLQDIVTALTNLRARTQSTPTLNIVASIAGGTGSGLFIPLAAAVRRKMNQNNIPVALHLYLVTPSAFVKNWDDDTSENAKSLRSRGFAGAFAAYREVMLLTEGGDPNSDPELRTVLGYPYVQGSDGAGDERTRSRADFFQRVWWWGRRSTDADRRADETFFEAGRLLTLLNDDAFFTKLEGKLQAGNNRRLAAVGTIEYPRLERAEATSAAAISYLASQIWNGSKEGSTRILDVTVPDLEQPPLLRFIRAERKGDMLGMGRDGGKATFESVKENLIDPMRLIRSGEPSAQASNQLINRVTKYQSPCNYAGTNDQWVKSLALADEQMRQRETETLTDLDQYLQWLENASVSWVAAAVGAASETETEAARTWPSLSRFARSLRALVEDLDFARLFFSKPVRDSVRNRVLQAPDTNRAAIAAYLTQLQKLVTPNARPQPPKGWYFSMAISGVLIVTSLGVLALAAVQTALRSIALLGGIITAVAGLAATLGTGLGAVLRTAGLPTLAGQPTAGTLMPIGVAILALGIAHLIWRSMNFVSVAAQRSSLERRWIRAWTDLVEAEMLERYWNRAREVSAHLVGDDVKPELIGSTDRVPSSSTVLGRVFRLVFGGQAWMKDLSEFAQTRENEYRDAHRKSWITEVGEYVRPSDAQLNEVLPKLKLKARIESVGNIKTVTDFDIVRNGSEQRNVPFSEWTDLPRTTSAKEAHDAALEGLYAELTGTILPEIAGKNLLKKTLREQMQAIGWDAGTLATELEKLVRQSQGRGLGASLTLRVEAAKGYLCIPDDEALRAELSAALRIARSKPSQRVSELADDDIFQTSNIGESIAYVQVATFAPEAGGAGSRLADIHNESRRTYYGEDHDRGDPGTTQLYNSRNTEFHLLPELSEAAEIENGAGLAARMLPPIIQRLYGTHHSGASIPSLFELYYLCRHKGYLQESTISVADEFRTKWRLHAGNDAEKSAGKSTSVPLISWPTAGSASEHDEFGRARDHIAVFDAFRVCLASRTENIGSAPIVRLPPAAQIETTEWKKPEVGAAVSYWRQRLWAEWSEMIGSQGSASRAAAYEAMERLAYEDADKMSPELQQQWRGVAHVILERGARNLAAGQ